MVTILRKIINPSPLFQITSAFTRKLKGDVRKLKEIYVRLKRFHMMKRKRRDERKLKGRHRNIEGWIFSRLSWRILQSSVKF
jgi:hypothetical protein